MSDKILIIGASVRAAAQSARRAGLQPYAADMFADTDLRNTCPTIEVKNYPHGLLGAARDFPTCPWMYTGGLENSPRLIEAIRAERQLFGNPAAVTRRVRNPWHLAAQLTARGLRVPALSAADLPLPNGEWLIKPLRTAGGRSICRLTSAIRVNPSAAIRSRCQFLQRFVFGEPAGAVFIGNAGHVELLGVTKQLIGVAGFDSKPFLYRGSIGPLSVSSTHQKQLVQIGQCLVHDFGLTGLFGVDVVFDSGRVWTIEVNPRYTASVEILERGFHLNAIQLHLACYVELPPQPLPAHPSRICGKEIVYANQDTIVDERFLDHVSIANADADWPQFADISLPGTRIQAGHPICTVFADGESPKIVAQRLHDRAMEVRSMFVQ